jgi:hypothetical protein
MNVLRAAFVVGLSVVLAANVVGVVTGAELRRYGRSADSAYAVARTSPYKSVRFTFGTYNFLRNHMAGKRLTIPAELHGHMWFLQRISRVRLDLLPETTLTAKQFRGLRRGSDDVGYLRTNGKVLELYYDFGPGTLDHYVIAENVEGNALVLTPARTYEALRPPP